MRRPVVGHLVDILKSIVASLAASFLWLVGARWGARWQPTVVISLWWIAMLVATAIFLVVYFWLRSRPFRLVYECTESPMEPGEGEAIADAGSRAKHVWHVDRSRGLGRAVLYGPYKKLPQELYMVRFRLKTRSHGPQSDVICDIAHSRGESTATTVRNLEMAVAPDTGGAYRDFLMRFEVGEDLSAHALEWRVRVEGSDAEVWADTITITRLG